MSTSTHNISSESGADDILGPHVTGDRSMLIVDDDDNFRQRLTRAMEERGFEVVAASSVAEGLREIAAVNPAFAIVDLRLADGNGLDVIASLKQQRSDARTIMLTGYGNITTTVTAVRLGAFDVLAKPADADEIFNALIALKHDTAAISLHPMTPDRVRYDHIQDVFEHYDRNVSETARRLKMHRRTLQRILAKRAPH